MPTPVSFTNCLKRELLSELKKCYKHVIDFYEHSGNSKMFIK